MTSSLLSPKSLGHRVDGYYKGMGMILLLEEVPTDRGWQHKILTMWNEMRTEHGKSADIARISKSMKICM